MGMGQFQDSDASSLFFVEFDDIYFLLPFIIRGGGMSETVDAAGPIVDGILRQKRYIYFPKIFALAPTVKE